MRPELTALAPGLLASGTLGGRLAFAGVFLVLAVCLALLPARFIGQEGGRPRPWRNVRYWAIAIALVQLVVYGVLG